ncbi:hypothetical protein H7K45_27610 [Mycobacterium yunnanensis]|uniref:Uncharacterized protein n=1 Tax=Mycobacterium yunnanensis TaxID=368477 RepID=A0A9X2Z8T0_9MYCO|nr:hypothetical protein [Mycobacterium yunnanensis]MCV7424321.1 hypothetical protein [Mycobacterium yunnanensis]
MMTSTYWVEMTLEVSSDTSIEPSFVSDFAEALDDCHDGQVVYTYSRKSRILNLAMSAESDEPIEQVVPKVVGTVRAAAHELGAQTHGWPEPVSIGDVKIKTLVTSMPVSA